MNRRNPQHVSRRWLLKAAGASAGAVALGGFVLRAPRAYADGGLTAGKAERAVATTPPAMRAVQLDPAAASLLGPLTPGTSLGRGFKIKDARGIHLGAIALVVEDTAGDIIRVDVMRRDSDGPSAPGEAGSFAVFVANQGRGKVRTDDGHEYVAQRIAALMHWRERTGVAVPGLLTHRERRDKHPRGIFDVRW